MGAPVRFQKAVPRTKEKRRGEAPIGAPVRVMGRLFPSAEGTGFAVRQPPGAAFRAREFRRSASLYRECEGFETDNLARQPAGMRRAATLPHGSINVRRRNDHREGIVRDDDVEVCADDSLRHARASMRRRDDESLTLLWLHRGLPGQARP